jgi:uncharacterized protein (TIRG00374 family)
MRQFQILRTRLAHWWSFGATRILTGAIVSAVFLVLALRTVPADQVWLTLGHVNPVWVGLTLVSIIVNTVAKAVRWKVLLGTEGQRIHLWVVLRALLVGQMLNTFIPTRVGDLSRAYTIGHQGPGTAFVLGTVVLEKLIDMVAFGLIILGLLVAIPLPDWAVGPAYQVLIVGTIVVSCAILLYHRRLSPQALAWVAQRFNHGLFTRLVDAARPAFESGNVLRRPTKSAKLIVLSALIWFTAILNNYLMLLAFQIDLPASAAVLLLVGLQLGISLPSLPGTIGVFEYVCVVVLALFAVERSTALSYGILLHAIVMIPSTVAGILMLLLARTVWRPSSRPPQIAERSE